LDINAYKCCCVESPKCIKIRFPREGKSEEKGRGKGRGGFGTMWERLLPDVKGDGGPWLRLLLNLF